MTPLPTDLRKSLDKSVVAARDAAEAACRAALTALGVEAREAPSSLSEETRALRVALRARQRQLAGEFEQLVTECAYEQWHLMLFARFLAENGLLIHPELRAAVSLQEVEELAREEGEDPWLLAAQFAAAMLPGIFKPADPCVRLPLAPESRKALEDILTALPPEVFIADDALGWVYQFWQTKRKKEVNASQSKIGGADLPPVTQLFTEHYMVRFLLENSLGAWWAARHPESPLLAEWEYLRYADDGTPAAGRFEGWPAAVAEVTVMDPCCGSGHFLVSAFEMLRKMREEEEALSAREAADAVLAENLYGLELDARCVQLGAFNLALAAWKVSGYHELPSLNLACSGIPTRGSLEEWTKLAKGEQRLELALSRLHELFREADTLGSLIDPRRAVEDGTLMSVPFEEVAPLLERALANEPDPVAAVFGDSAREVAKAAALLACKYRLVVTNPPYLARGKQREALATYVERWFNAGRADLATALLMRCAHMSLDGGTDGLVLPQNSLFLQSYSHLRKQLLSTTHLNVIAKLGSNAFRDMNWWAAVTMLILFTVASPPKSHEFGGIDVSRDKDQAAKASLLQIDPIVRASQHEQLTNAGHAITFRETTGLQLLDSIAESYKGITTGDDPRFRKAFWELQLPHRDWIPFLSTVSETSEYGGRSNYLLWEEGRGALCASPTAYIRADSIWGRAGVAVSQMGSLPVSIYLGEAFDTNVGAIVPKDEANHGAIWSFAASGEFSREVREIDASLKVTNSVFVQVPFDLPHWQRIAEEQYPGGLPEPQSEDPTQWLFRGNVIGSEEPLHVALARLLSYRWPDQEPDGLDHLADYDGIVCLPSVSGERPAHERLREVLAAAYGEAFSQQTVDELLASEGSANLEDWLRDKAFASHAKLFHTRPFIWHIWDGRKDGFSALVNYHRLDHQALQKLTYSYLGWWIDRQRADAAAEVAGADTLLAAATALQEKLKLILEGEPPYDIYVRWKPLAEQPLGWEPDLNDGVRLNIRPFVEAGVLRSKLNIHWKKDRGKNPDGSERLNDLHFTLAEKRAAREEAGRGG
jgi:hypothetical protein